MRTHSKTQLILNKAIKKIDKPMMKINNNTQYLPPDQQYAVKHNVVNNKQTILKST